MTKLRLLHHHRQQLRLFARQSLVCAQEAAAEDVAYRQLLANAEAAIKFLLPEADLVVLRRHKATQHANAIVFSKEGAKQGSRYYMRVCFCPRDPTEKLSLYTNGCHTPLEGRIERELADWMARNVDILELPEAAANDIPVAYKTWLDAAQAHDSAREQILGEVYAAIDSARTLEALMEIWPAAALMREQLCGRALPMALEPSERERIIAAATFVPPTTTP